METRLTPTGNSRFGYHGKQRKEFLECRCLCGNITWVAIYKYKSRATRSCGCLGREKISKLRRTHGLTKTHTYVCYYGMKSRCTNENQEGWKWYGGRGIKICDRWLASFENFIEDMGMAPSPIHSIDRIDSDLDYTPDNCRWATPREQANNTRRNNFLNFDGQNLSVTEVSRLTGVPRSTISGLLNLHKLSKEDTVLAIKNHPKYVL